MITAAEARKTYETTTNTLLQESLATIESHIKQACQNRTNLTLDSSKIRGDLKEVIKALESKGFKANSHSCQRDGEWLEVSW